MSSYWKLLTNFSVFFKFKRFSSNKFVVKVGFKEDSLASCWFYFFIGGVFSAQTGLRSVGEALICRRCRLIPLPVLLRVISCQSALQDFLPFKAQQIYLEKFILRSCRISRASGLVCFHFDDVVLLASSCRDLQRAPEWFPAGGSDPPRLSCGSPPEKG